MIYSFKNVAMFIISSRKGADYIPNIAASYISNMSASVVLEQWFRFRKRLETTNKVFYVRKKITGDLILRVHRRVRSEDLNIHVNNNTK